MGENIIHVTKGKKAKEIATVLKHESINQNGIREENNSYSSECHGFKLPCYKIQALLLY